MAQAKDRKQAPGRRKTQSAGREQHADQRSPGNGGGASSRGHGGRIGSGGRGSGGKGRADH